MSLRFRLSALFLRWSLRLMGDCEARRLLLWHLDRFPDLVARYRKRQESTP